MRRVISISFLLFLLCVGSCYAATYHVRTDGHDTTCNGSADASVAAAPNCAFLTPQKGVVTGANPDDLVIVHAGDYSSTLTTVNTTASGTSGHPITIRADTSETVIFGRAIIDQNYIVFSGIKLISPGLGDGTTASVLVSGSYNTVSGCTIVGGVYYTSAGSYGLTVSGNNNLIDGNTFDGELNYVGTHTGPNGSADLVDSTKTWTENELQGLFIRNHSTGKYNTSITSNTANTITATLTDGGTWNTGDYYLAGKSFRDVIAVRGTNNIISNNTIKRLADTEKVFQFSGGCDNTIIRTNEMYTLQWSQTPNVHPDIFQRVKPTSGDRNCRNVLIERNYMHDMDTQVGIVETDNADEVTGWVFRGNILANITQAYMMGGNIYNNTFYLCGGDDLASSQRTIGAGDGMSLKNNIIITRNTDPEQVGILLPTSCTGTIDIDNNYYANPDFTAKTAAILGGGSVVCNPNVAQQRLADSSPVNGGDPLFTAAYSDCVNNTCDFHIAAGSPLIDAGANLSAIWADAVDKDGVSRPVGAAWDIGAYEYQSGADTTAPSLVTVDIDDDQILSGTASIPGSCTDDTACTGMQLFVDGVTAGSEDTSSPWSVTINTQDWADGVHELEYRGRDAAGNNTKSGKKRPIFRNRAGAFSGFGAGTGAMGGMGAGTGKMTM